MFYCHRFKNGLKVVINQIGTWMFDHQKEKELV
jgi:hypothetical protein